MIVKKYCLKLNQFSKYSPDTMAEPRESMGKFVTRLSDYLVVKKVRTTILIGDMDLARLMIHAK